MATIALYANKINQMPGLLNDAKKSVTNYKSELSKLRKKTLGVDKRVCNMDNIISSVQSSTQTQEKKIQALDKIRKDSEQFITATAQIDSKVEDTVNKRKNDFYEKYYYLKPECEKSRWEKIKDKCKKVGEWCKAHWKAIVTVLVVIAAIVVIVAFPGLSAVLLMVAKGIVSGAIIGGLMGGLESVSNGGSFWEGAENGAFSGALWGAAFGLVGGMGHLAVGGLAKFPGLLGKLGGCEKVMQCILTTGKVSGRIALGMFGFDVASLGLKLKFGDNPISKFNEGLHNNPLYNGFQFSVSLLAAFSGGASQRIKDGFRLCFAAGTMVLTANGLVAIELIKPGDKVIATNPATHQTEEKKVLETYINKTNELWKLSIHNEEITTTANHPFYVKNRGFIAARLLCTGDEIVTATGGSYPVESVEVVEKQEIVYNFEVEDYHTYYVGDSSLLVHNDCGRTRLPRNNGEWEGEPGNGKWYSDNPNVLEVTKGEGVTFKDGRPDFSPWKKGTLNFKEGVLDGSKKDFSAVYAKIKQMKGFSTLDEAKNWLREKGLTPHHKTSTKIELIPTKLHGNVPHIGSASDLRGGN